MIHEPSNICTVTPESVTTVVELVAHAVSPSKIILFGSCARGEQRSDSDIDLLVITNSGENREDIRLAIEKALRGRRVDIDLLVRTPEDVDWNREVENPFYTETIFREGIVAYERQGTS